MFLKPYKRNRVIPYTVRKPCGNTLSERPVEINWQKDLRKYSARKTSKNTVSERSVEIRCQKDLWHHHAGQEFSNPQYSLFKSVGLAKKLMAWGEGNYCLKLQRQWCYGLRSRPFMSTYDAEVTKTLPGYMEAIFLKEVLWPPRDVAAYYCRFDPEDIPNSKKHFHVTLSR
jgi:hypothetical protein